MATKSYLPLYRPADAVTFVAAAPVEAGMVVEVGSLDMSVVPARAGSGSVVGVAGFSAITGDRVTVEVGKPVHEVKAVGRIECGERLQAASGGGVTTLDQGVAIFVALTAANDGAPVRALQI